jgi:pyruvate/2-oxoglutarate dehydrogenase complex dihydrolipoamide dehydrogenase (E3) component
MSQAEHFDTVILGSGQGGKLLAWHLGRSGQRVAVVERQWVGGSCPAVACLPSKNEIWSARVAHLAQRAADFGTITGPVTVDMAKVRERKRGMIEREVAFHLQAYASSGAELIMGSGRFVAPKTIEVQLNNGGTRTLIGDQVVINVGSHAAIPDIPGLPAARPLTHIGALDLDYAPAHLIVLGGGYIGIEMAQPYRRFGSRVTIVEHGQQLMGREDADVADEMSRVLSGEGIDILLGAETLRVEGQSHVSVDDFRIVRDNLAGGNRSTRDRLVPYTMFSDPPLAHVGLSEREAQKQGIGSEAGEVMAAIQTAMLAELPYPKLRDAVITHLTFAEGFGPLLASVPPRATAQ